jgi:thymidylate synthase (FAD)
MGGLYDPCDVLDHGFVRLVRHMGDDGAIVQAARVSYGSGTKTVREDAALIDYLIRNQHSTPLESVVLVYHMKLPIFVARQFVRHRTARINEESARYSKMEYACYTPAQWRTQAAANKQCSGHPLPESTNIWATDLLERAYKSVYQTYEDLLLAGVSREQARIILPVGLYTEWYYQMDLNNLFKFFALRLHEHAQEEAREYAKAMYAFAKAVAPVACSSFEKHVLSAKGVIVE